MKNQFLNVVMVNTLSDKEYSSLELYDTLEPLTSEENELDYNLLELVYLYFLVFMYSNK